MVPVAGLEPARCRHRWILSPLRLPIPSHRQNYYKEYNNIELIINQYFYFHFVYSNHLLRYTRRYGV